MWRWISGVQRAIRHHIHGQRVSAAGVCKDEDHELESHREEACHSHHTYKTYHFRNEHHAYEKKENNYEENKEENGPHQEKEYKHGQCPLDDFWKIFSEKGPFEALGWGTAVVLGLHLSKHPKLIDQWERERKKHPFCCKSLFYRVAFALPDKTRRSIVESSEQKLQFDACHVGDTQLTEDSITEGKDESRPLAEEEKAQDPLENVMREFENVCRKYTAMGKNMEGVRQAASGKIKQAVNSWSEATNLGYAKAQYNLALCYETGRGVVRDIKRAVKYYKIAADDNHPMAMYNLAILYLTGDGVSLDEKKAIDLMERAAKLGLVQAQTYLGVYYTGGPCMDKEKAVNYFREAALQNDTEAEYLLGVCYEEGWGVEQNLCKACSLYAQAASDGHDGAMYNLAVFHEHGLGGLPEDRVTALELYQKSAACGNESARHYLGLQSPDTTLPQEEWTEQYMYDFVVEPKIKDAVLTEKSKEDITSSNDHFLKIQYPLYLSSSMSTPSLTEYVRKHLQDLDVGFKPHPDSDVGFKPLHDSDAGFKPLRGSDEKFKPLSDMIKSQTSLPKWQPQFGSPKIACSPLSWNNGGVTFSIGVNEDDMVDNAELWKNNDIFYGGPSLLLESDHHHFSSMLQRNATMPDIRAVTFS